MAGRFLNKDVLEQGTRNIVYELIKLNGGIHFRKICRALNAEMGLIQYHLGILEKAYKIFSIMDGRYKCYFITTLKNPTIPDKEFNQKRMIDILLRRKTSSQFLLEVYHKPDITNRDLAKNLGITSQAITWRAKRLREDNLILSQRTGKIIKHKLTEIPQKYIAQKIEGIKS